MGASQGPSIAHTEVGWEVLARPEAILSLHVFATHQRKAPSAECSEHLSASNNMGGAGSGEKGPPWRSTTGGRSFGSHSPVGPAWELRFFVSRRVRNSKHFTMPVATAMTTVPKENLDWNCVALHGACNGLGRLGPGIADLSEAVSLPRIHEEPSIQARTWDFH